MLRERNWQYKYTTEDGGLVQRFYVPALEDAERYDRLTGYFNAGALALAARGIEGLVRNQGKMRLVVGCTLQAPEVEAIMRGEALRAQVERHLADLPLAPPDQETHDALELLAWMIARGFLDVKVAVPCDGDRNPIPDDALFHEKTGIVEDRSGDRIAWTGSLNETVAGWRQNWESISVHTSWGPEPGRVDAEEASFLRLWQGEAPRLIVLDVPTVARDDLLRFKPKTGLPTRLAPKPAEEHSKSPPSKREKPPPPEASQTPPPADDLRQRVWSFIQAAPALPGGEGVGEATAGVEPWPHQSKVFQNLCRTWPPRLLIADEVGLGKTIQAGMFLRQAWLAGCAKRILILTPKAVLRQWQIELREKFNLNWPIYDDGKLLRYPSPALRGRNEREVGRDGWRREPVLIASSHLMRRTDRAADLLEKTDPWDLVVLDEAHHARRRAAGSQKEGGPNALLALMQGLKERSQGLLLLTATPMQVNPVEVWDLLNLLGLPPEWNERAFLEYFEDIEQSGYSEGATERVERMAALFRATESAYGQVVAADAQRLGELSRLKANKVLRALRDTASIPRRQLDPAERRAALGIMRANTPVKRLISRHTRTLLRRYIDEGRLSAPIAKREVQDRFLPMTAPERAIYEAVEDYIANAYSQASDRERSAVGFVMTIYRRRLASSFAALRETLCKRRNAIDQPARMAFLEEDLPDDEAVDEVIDRDEAEDLEREALAREQKAEIDRLLTAIAQLPPDSKLGALRETLHDLRRRDRQAMVFTQYTDSMDFLRQALVADGDWKLVCFSGRGGEIAEGGEWRNIGRDEVKRRFRDGEADILLCTDAAAEGLNFQFCGALVNYDMPWNPMRVEQRIGRIDRLGQRFAAIRIVNLHYEDTVETDIYRVLRERIGLFESVVGNLQPILAKLPRTISQTALDGSGSDQRRRENLVAEIKRDTTELESAGFDIDAVTADDLTLPRQTPPSVTMADLDRIIGAPALMPPGVKIQPLGPREYSLQAPGMSESVRVTTDPEYFSEHTESVELWSPGNPLFEPPEVAPTRQAFEPQTTLCDILDGD